MNTKKPTGKMGRPPKPKDEKQGERVTVNMTREEREALTKEAACAGLSLAAFLLDCWRRSRGAALSPAPQAQVAGPGSQNRERK